MDVVVIGAGLVGLAIARRIQQVRPGASVLVVDKEDHVAAHQSGHNSGVVHAGVYYPPGSLKAQLVRRGVGLLREFAAEHDVAWQDLGKVVVATTGIEQHRLTQIAERAEANGVPGVNLLGPSGLRDLEPHVVGVAALHSPTTAVIDFPGVARALAAQIEAEGGEVRLSCEVTGLTEGADGVYLPARREMSGSPFAHTEILTAREVVICAGLHADRLAQFAGGAPDPAIVPFRGEYHLLRPERAHLVSGLVYPVPDPRYPFLGVHLTRRVDGSVDVGPNAVLALAREGYGRMDLNWADVRDYARSPGLRSMAREHWPTGVREVLGSVSGRRFVDAARRYVPELRAADLTRGPSGVRAQALDRDGSLVDDFVIERSGAVTAVRNAPSPAATSCLAIAEHVVDRLAWA